MGVYLTMDLIVLYIIYSLTHKLAATATQIHHVPVCVGDVFPKVLPSHNKFLLVLAQIIIKIMMDKILNWISKTFKIQRHNVCRKFIMRDYALYAINTFIYFCN